MRDLSARKIFKSADPVERGIFLIESFNGEMPGRIKSVPGEISECGEINANAASLVIIGSHLLEFMPDTAGIIEKDPHLVDLEFPDENSIGRCEELTEADRWKETYGNEKQ
jgi:hypothetical protein